MEPETTNYEPQPFELGVEKVPDELQFKQYPLTYDEWYEIESQRLEQIRLGLEQEYEKNMENNRLMSEEARREFFEEFEKVLSGCQ